MSHIPEDVRPPCMSAPELFFPVKGGSPRQAKRLCAQCRVQCLREPLSVPGVVFGIWGGTTEYERRAMRRARTS